MYVSMSIKFVLCAFLEYFFIFIINKVYFMIFNKVYFISISLIINGKI